MKCDHCGRYWLPGESHTPRDCGAAILENECNRLSAENKALLAYVAELQAEIVNLKSITRAAIDSVASDLTAEELEWRLRAAASPPPAAATKGEDQP